MSRAWMPLYVADYLADTGHLSAAEHGAYLLLIMHYWQNGGLPNEDRRLARIARMSPLEWEDSREVLFDLFEDGWKHHRIEAELAAANGIMESRSRAGSAGATSKWGSARAAKATRSQRLAEAREKGSHVKEQWDAMVSHCGGKCVRCNAPGPVVKDHIIPIYQGGSDGVENLQPLCTSCNSSKGPDTTDFRPDGWQAKCLTNASQTPAPSQPQSHTPPDTNVSGGVGRKAPPEHVQILDCLKGVLSEDRAKAVVEHRRKMKKPLGLHGAKLLLAQLQHAAEPDKAADLMIVRGWQGFEPEWGANAGLKLVSSPSQSTAGAAQVFVEIGTEEWDAWTAFKGKKPPFKYYPEHQADGWLFPSKMPPTPHNKGERAA